MFFKFSIRQNVRFLDKNYKFTEIKISILKCPNLHFLKKITLIFLFFTDNIDKKRYSKLNMKVLMLKF